MRLSDEKILVKAQRKINKAYELIDAKLYVSAIVCAATANGLLESMGHISHITNNSQRCEVENLFNKINTLVFKLSGILHK